MGRRAPSLPAKFALAILLIGVSFLVMAVLGKLSADGSLVGWWWLVLVFFIQVIAELLLSPTGPSASTQLAPWRYGESGPCPVVPRNRRRRRNWRARRRAAGDARNAYYFCHPRLATIIAAEFSPPRSSDYAC